MDLLGTGLGPYVAREMKLRRGPMWGGETRPDPKAKTAAGAGEYDPHELLGTIWNEWEPVFRQTLGRAEKTLVAELRDVRNRWAHGEAFSTDDAYRAIDSVARLLNAVSAAAEAEEVEKQKQELLRVRFEEQARTEKRKAASATIEGQPRGELKPWRDVQTPHPDVASGRYQQAEFAADLWQVYLNEGSDEYRKPVDFFGRTFLTEGLEQLLLGALRRIAGTGGDP